MSLWAPLLAAKAQVPGHPWGQPHTADQHLAPPWMT